MYFGPSFLVLQTAGSAADNSLSKTKKLCVCPLVNNIYKNDF